MTHCCFLSTSPPTEAHPHAPTSSDSPHHTLPPHLLCPIHPCWLSLDFCWSVFLGGEGLNFFLLPFCLPYIFPFWSLWKKQRIIPSEGLIRGKSLSAKQNREAGTVIKRPTWFPQRNICEEGAAYFFFSIISITWHLSSMYSAPTTRALNIYLLSISNHMPLLRQDILWVKNWVSGKVRNLFKVTEIVKSVNLHFFGSKSCVFPSLSHLPLKQGS